MLASLVLSSSGRLARVPVSQATSFIEMVTRPENLGKRYFVSNNSSCGPFSIPYEETIRALNGLQSNTSSAHSPLSQKTPNQSKNLEDSLKYLLRCGVTLEEFERRVPVIHVSGTKGKGSTCALCESILRAHGYRTGLYTSPHLVCVRERIRLNGSPLSPDVFSKYFWEVYSRLSNNKEHETDMPMYFKFLTVMAFYVFLAEKVDVAIIEVGIGGEQDCTNILRKTPVVGITSLGLDHTNILGDTIEKIAWEKAGIIKPGSIALTVSKPPPRALDVLRARAEEKQVSLRLVPDLEAYRNLDTSRLNFSHRLNLPLALQLAYAWMKWKSASSNGLDFNTTVDDTTLQGILQCSWLGRFQAVERGKHIFYLDGAHTQESTQLCAEWFNSVAPRDVRRLLVFNATRGRSPKNLLKPFSSCNIETALFCSNILTVDSSKIPQDIVNKTVTVSQSEEVMKNNARVWQEMSGTESNRSLQFVTVEETINFIDSIEEACHVLVTGSIHLVGAVLTLLRHEPS